MKSSFVSYCEAPRRLHVALSCPTTWQNDQPPTFLDFIGVLEKIFTDSKSEVFINVRWYYRPEV